MRMWTFLLAVPALCLGAREEWPSGSRATPPTIASVAPRGVPRGSTVELAVEGFNLGRASAILFSQPGIAGRVTGSKVLPELVENRLGSNGTASTVDLGPMPERNQVTIDVTIPASAELGAVEFRLVTPLGTTPTGRFVVEPYYGETSDREPNETPEQATETTLPAILTGAISKPGDTDVFRFHAEAGQSLAVDNLAPLLGSPLRPLITISDAKGNVLRQEKERSFRVDFPSAGEYFLRITDLQEGGSMGHQYRLALGQKALGPNVLTLEPIKKIAPGVPVNGSPSDLAHAETVMAPVKVSGRLTAKEQNFRFHSAAGEKWIMEVTARREGSPLDSVLDVLTPDGKPVEQATVRAVLETSLTLRDHDSNLKGLRIASDTGLKPGDYFLVGSEILRIETLPAGPDNDCIFDSKGGAERVGYFDTTPEAHALDEPAYKVQIAPPGTAFPSNGLPLIHLPYRNDDGGPGYGKDSLLHFQAPREGDYVVRLRDVRGFSGGDYVYTLEIRHPRPAYELTVNPRNPNVPAGGRIPLTVSAMRFDGFDGPIEIEARDLPAGVHATRGTILPGDVRTTLIVSADADAKAGETAPLHITDAKGQAAEDDEHLQVVTVTPRADVHMESKTASAVLAPGRTATIAVAIQRNNGFAGRVPVEVRNLPPGVEIVDTGLNGVLLNENETERTFTLRMLPTARPHTQPIYASGLVETRAGGQQNTFASQAITLTIQPGKDAQ